MTGPNPDSCPRITGDGQYITVAPLPTSESCGGSVTLRCDQTATMEVTIVTGVRMRSDGLYVSTVKLEFECGLLKSVGDEEEDQIFGVAKC